MRRILVTGGAGFIGSALCNRLADEGHQVTALDNLSRGKKERLAPRVRFVEADVREPDAVRSAVLEADLIFHLAYVQGTEKFYSRPGRVIDVALTGMMNLLHACEQHQGRELILVSSSEAYQVPESGNFPTDETVPLSVPDVSNPRYSYGGGKVACEVAAMAYAQEGVFSRTVVLRPHNIYGPDMGSEHVIPQFCARMSTLPASSQEPTAFVIQGTGQETRSFCFITDCTDAFVVAMERGEDKNVYNVGTDLELISISELAQTVARRYDRLIRVEASASPKGSPSRRLPNIDKLRALGYQPRVSLDIGLSKTADWYRETRAGA